MLEIQDGCLKLNDVEFEFEVGQIRSTCVDNFSNWKWPSPWGLPVRPGDPARLEEWQEIPAPASSKQSYFQGFHGQVQVGQRDVTSFDLAILICCWNLQKHCIIKIPALKSPSSMCCPRLGKGGTWATSLWENGQHRTDLQHFHHEHFQLLKHFSCRASGTCDAGELTNPSTMMYHRNCWNIVMMIPCFSGLVGIDWVSTDWLGVLQDGLLKTGGCLRDEETWTAGPGIATEIMDHGDFCSPAHKPRQAEVRGRILSEIKRLRKRKCKGITFHTFFILHIGCLLQRRTSARRFKWLTICKASQLCFSSVDDWDRVSGADLLMCVTRQVEIDFECAAKPALISARNPRHQVLDVERTICRVGCQCHESPRSKKHKSAATPPDWPQLRVL